MRPFLLTLWSAVVITGGLAVADDPPDVAPPPPRTSGNLLEKVVSQSLRLADEEDPLRRADWCAELADDLAEELALASARGDTDEALRLGRHLNEVLKRGVVGNFGRLDPTELDPPRLAELEKVGQRAKQIPVKLEKNLFAGPWPPPPSLKRFVEEARRGWENILKHSPSPWGGKGKDGFKGGKDGGKGKDGFKGGKDGGKGGKDGFKGGKGGKGKVRTWDDDRFDGIKKGKTPSPWGPLGPGPLDRRGADLGPGAAPQPDVRRWRLAV